MNLNIKVDGVAPVQWALKSMGGAQAKRATTLWCNWIGIEAQGEMRRQLASRFALRGTREGFEKAIVFQAATQSGARERQAVLKVGGPGFGQSRTEKLGRILARHEEAETRTESGQVYFDGRGRAMTGLGFFLPANGLRTSTSNPPKSLYPSSIGATMRLTPDSRLILAKGTKKGSKKKGTGVSYFATRQGVFRRRHTSFGRSEVQAVWWFVGRVRTPARLGLWDTAQQVFDRRALALGLQAIEETLIRDARKALR